ncbi:MAG: hypothetical protein MR707_08280 [Galactobacillus timonensis]|uniref:hypothetical protein n=1 Tax=Galactobacillus timonensis TaxID=2041840 RepID=UPI0023F1E476|nr:hypothetical protein [Galactobacillus timonensis]MCI6068202.1 hypothetical protein [Galactobacillus timonensis]
MTEIERKIQDAEIEISLAIGILEWTRTVASKTYCAPFLGSHVNGRIDGLENALRTIRELKAIASQETADVHGSKQN